MIVRVLKRTLQIAAVLLVLIVAYFAVTFVQIWLRGHEHSTHSAQAILVFGTTEDDGVPSRGADRSAGPGPRGLSSRTSALDRRHRREATRRRQH